jgi:DNA polymerase/3'-5' exonuclease PolX
MNNELIKNLQILANYYKKTGDNWRQQAYQRAIVGIRTYNKQITTPSQLKGIKGVGKGIAKKIVQFLNTGKINLVEDVKKKMKEEKPVTKKEEIIQSLKGIFGVGPVKAESLYKKGIRSLSGLRKRKEFLTRQQKIGLKYYKDLLEPIPRLYITALKSTLKLILNKEFGDGTYKLEIAGSYRRGLFQSGDIDLLLTSEKYDLEDIVRTLIKWKVITDTLSMKTEKWMGIATCPAENGKHVRMDIEFVPQDEWASALVYFTGSKGFNILMRGEAKKKEYLLNQHGIFKKGKRIETPTERSIFEELKMKYVPPRNR